MKQISEELRQAMEESTLFYPTATITFADGSKKDIGYGDFNLSGNSITDSAYTSSFPVGILVSKQINISLMNDEDQWSEYDFYGASIFLRTNYDLKSGLTEQFNIGTFTVITPETYGTTIEVTAMDDSYKTDKDYSTGLKYPLSVGEALRDSCRTCGITLFTTTFSNDNFIIQQAPTDLTHRQFIGLCAMIAGSNARFDEYNRLVIMEYDFSAFNKPGLDGGRFDPAMPYATGDTADGGSFNPWDIGYVCDGGEFGDRANIHVLYEFKSGMTIGVDDVVITGIQLNDSDSNPHLFGKEGYVIALSNQLTAGKEDEVAELIGNKLVGLRFRPFTADHICYPMADFMDLAYLIDRNQNVYQTVITDVDFQYFGFATLKCSADSPIRNSSKYYGSEAKAIVAARKITKDKITEYDLSVQSLTNLITQSFGVFKTEEMLEDGSTIFYLHNRPTLEASTTIWKMAADAFAVSTDGGKTYTAGMDAHGNAVVNVLSAIGINFDWAHGGNLTLGGNSNISGSMRILNASGQQIGKWDKDGISAMTGTFAGNLEAAGGTFKGNLQAAGGSFSGTLQAASGSFSGDVKATSGSFTNVTINGCTLDTNVLTGLLSGGTLSGNAISGGTLSGNTGGTYVGTHSGGRVSSCTLGGTSLTTGSGGYFGSDSFGSLMYGDNYARIKAGNTNIYVGSGGSGSFEGDGSFYIHADLKCYGEKDRVISTEHYGERCLDAFETPVPTFSDYGVAKLNEKGECHIVIDPIFSETVSKYGVPTVFITKYGRGDVWVDIQQSTHDIIVVCGTPNLEFSWETRYKQANCYQDRLRVLDFDKTNVNNYDFAGNAQVDYEHNSIDYVHESMEYLYLYNQLSVNYADEGYNYFKHFERSIA